MRNRTAAILLLVVIAAGFSAGRYLTRPRLIVGDSVAGDLAALATDAWHDLRAAFPAHLDCIGSIRLEAVPDLPEQGAYDAPTRTIQIRVPLYESTARNTFLHEAGHHLDHRCSTAADLRPAFAAAQGLPHGSAWDAGRTWQETPAEMWAEAVAVHAGGTQQRSNSVPISAEALRIVARWASGS